MPRNKASATAILEKSPTSPFDRDMAAGLDGSAARAIPVVGPYSVFPRPAAAAQGKPEAIAGERLDEPCHAEIAAVAYQLWLDRNCGHGGDVEDWYLAIEIIRRRSMS
jgi:hypothetical protein